MHTYRYLSLYAPIQPKIAILMPRQKSTRKTEQTKENWYLEFPNHIRFQSHPNAIADSELQNAFSIHTEVSQSQSYISNSIDKSEIYILHHNRRRSQRTPRTRTARTYIPPSPLNTRAPLNPSNTKTHTSIPSQTRRGSQVRGTTCSGPSYCGIAARPLVPGLRRRGRALAVVP
jgi:hypothetical protein